VPALVDTGAQFSCIRSDVIEYLYMRGESCGFLPCSLTCLLADGRKAQVNNAVKLHVRLLAFSWDHEFKILEEGPFAAILGMDFLTHTQMRVDVGSRTFGFAFAHSRVGSFGPGVFQEDSDPYFRQLCDEAAGLLTAMKTRPSDLDCSKLKREFPSLFSTTLGVAKCAPYEIKLSDTTPVRSAPYRCAPPKVQTFKQVVNELLEQGVVRPSKSPYASPVFLVPKNSGGVRMVVDYRKVNAKIVFDS